MLEDVLKHSETEKELIMKSCDKNISHDNNNEKCPECGNTLSRHEGCKICWSCQYSACK